MPQDERFRQILLFDENLNFVRSDDKIFPTQKLQDITLERWLPFMESIGENLKKLDKEDEELIFSRVESPAAFLPGSYDFSFSTKTIGGKNYILWKVFDYTDTYDYLTRYQQLKNEQDIYRQKIEYHNGEINKIEDLFS